MGADGRGLRPIEGITGFIGLAVWSGDSKSLYISASQPRTRATIWKANGDGSGAHIFLENCCYALGVSPDEKYLLAYVSNGDDVGIYQVSIADKKRTPLLPGVVTYMLWYAADGKSFMYAVESKGEVTIYRQGWRNGQLVGQPQIALKIPFAFRFAYNGNAYDFSRDLTSLVYSRPGGEADLYLLSPEAPLATALLRTPACKAPGPVERAHGAPRVRGNTPAHWRHCEASASAPLPCGVRFPQDKAIKRSYFKVPLGLASRDSRLRLTLW